jgi:hypothetical protein
VAGTEPTKTSFLFVQSFGAGSIATGDDGKLILTADHLAGQTIYFSDRPERIAGMVSTETFLGTGSATPTENEGASATPEGGINFTPADPPNAALVFAGTEGDDDPGNVLVVELIDPTYDPTTGQATYEIKVLDDDTAVDMRFVSEPVSDAHAIRSFDSASLFIDDCGDGSVACYNPSTGGYLGLVSIGACYVWTKACCDICDMNADFAGICAEKFGASCMHDQGLSCDFKINNTEQFACRS